MLDRLKRFFGVDMYTEPEEEEITTEKLSPDEILHATVKTIVELFEDEEYPVSVMSSVGLSLILTSLETMKQEGYKQNAEEIVNEAISAHGKG